MARFKPQILEVKIDKLVHGGQGLGTLPDGKKALVWNVLPGELVRFETKRSKSSFVEGIATEILEKSSRREEPRDELYLSTSPWQMMGYESENEFKKQILTETINRAHVNYDGEVEFFAPDEHWNYRNKMEYSFYGDDNGLHLALYNRGTHQKQIVTGSTIARPEIDEVANKVCVALSNANVRAGDLKTVIVRCNEVGETVAALFVKREDFEQIEGLSGICKGLAVVYSDPKSPASVRTQDLYQFGDISLTDKVSERSISYDVFSFFQVNLPIFRTALKSIDQVSTGKVIDLYSGVGTIGLSLGSAAEMLIESDKANISWAKQNTFNTNSSVVHATSESALEYIDNEHTIIVDPPRAGLHPDLTNRLLDVNPPKIIYLSCNPSTQARDLERLQSEYSIQSIAGYNFFPRTPHIEALVILEKK